MDIVSETLGLYNGVSTQDEILRLSNQVSESINCYHTLDMGLRRRNPTSILSQDIGITSETFIYNYERDIEEKYSIVISSGTMKAIDLSDGTTKTVNNISSAFNYLVPFSNSGFSAVTVKDTTFIVNKNKQVLSDNTTQTDPNINTVIIWVKRAEPVTGYNYYVKINGSAQIESTGIKSTHLVAADIVTKLTAQGYSCTSIGNMVRITGTTITSVEAFDNVGDTAITYIWKNVNGEAELPAEFPVAWNNYTVVVGGKTSGNAQYWLKYSNGVWKETYDPTIYARLNYTTMPHKLTRKEDISGNVYFDFEVISWNNKEVGDSEYSKDPSFIGSYITDIFFYRNRLGFLSKDGITFSQDGNYYNLFRTTQVSVLDSDRIDVIVDSKKVLNLQYAEFLQDDIILFGDKSQFRLNVNSGTLTPYTISATMISEYDVNTSIRPFVIDDKIIFLAKNINTSSVYMFTKDKLGVVNSAECISAQVPDYIDGNIRQITGSSVNSILFFRSNENKDTLYVYKYYEQGNELIQSAWSKWKFDGDIFNIFVSESKLFIVLNRFNRITDEEWFYKDGIINDEYEWNDEYPVLDSLDSARSNIEVLDIFPKPIDTTFSDIGSVEYSSDVTLSRYIPKQSNKARLSDTVSLKTLSVKATDDSKFDIVITNKGNERVVDKKYSAQRRLFIGGKPKETSIKIGSNSSLGFEINGIAIEARINNRSRSM